MYIVISQTKFSIKSSEVLHGSDNNKKIEIYAACVLKGLNITVLFTVFSPFNPLCPIVLYIGHLYHLMINKHTTYDNLAPVSVFEIFVELKTWDIMG